MKFVRQASSELMDASAHYEQRREGLGNEFLNEVNAALDRIELNPRAYPEVRPFVRRCRTNRFPYGVVYTLIANEIRIIAIAHLHRDPEYWIDRLK